MFEYSVIATAATGNDITGNTMSLDALETMERSVKTGDEIREQLGAFRTKSADAAQVMNETFGDGAQTHPDYSAYLDSMKQPSQYVLEIDGRRNPTGMPAAEDVGSALERYADMMKPLVAFSESSMFFSIGASITTKVDGTAKMFLQAQ